MRCPGWASGLVGFKVNGEPFKTDSNPGTYALLDRTWQNGDVLEVTLPMDLRVEPMPDNHNMIALFYGPILLAGALGREAMTPGMSTGWGPNGPPISVPALVTGSRPPNDWIKKVTDEPLRFMTTGVGRPKDVLLLPFYQVQHERQSVYWEVLSEEQWKDRSAAQAKKEADLAARTVDQVQPGDDLSERTHKLQACKDCSASDSGWRKCREPRDWFSYDMKVSPDQEMVLVCTYWGEYGGQRTHHIFVDGRKIATQVLNGGSYDLVSCEYPIPKDLTAGKTKVTVKFQAVKDHWPSPIYDCVMRKRG